MVEQCYFLLFYKTILVSIDLNYIEYVVEALLENSNYIFHWNTKLKKITTHRYLIGPAHAGHRYGEMVSLSILCPRSPESYTSTGP